jgi:hypothetical protein
VTDLTQKTATSPAGSLLIVLLLIVVAAPLFAAEEQHESVMLSEETEMDLRRFPSEGSELILGFPCDQGMGEAEAQSGEVLSERRLEVWLADLLGAHFLPTAPSSMRSLEGAEVANLIQHAVTERSDKRIVLTASGYGAIPALRGALIWQQQHPEDKHLLGAILFFPMLTATTPEPGKPIEYLPVVSQTRLPIVMMQPGNTPTRFWAGKLKKELEKGGSRVHIELLPKVRGFFYSRADATAEERAMAQRLPELVEQAVATLKQLEEQP